MTTTDRTVFDNIFTQLGAGQFVAMTGAKNFVYDTNSLTCKLGHGGKGTHLRITLDASDTYTVETLKVGRFCEVAVVASDSDVYVDQLRATVEAQTGFFLSLGPKPQPKS